jgi:hypothetical protein
MIPKRMSAAPSPPNTCPVKGRPRHSVFSFHSSGPLPLDSIDEVLLIDGLVSRPSGCTQAGYAVRAVDVRPRHLPSCTFGCISITYGAQSSGARWPPRNRARRSTPGSLPQERRSNGPLARLPLLRTWFLYGSRQPIVVFADTRWPIQSQWGRISNTGRARTPSLQFAVQNVGWCTSTGVPHGVSSAESIPQSITPTISRFRDTA